MNIRKQFKEASNYLRESYGYFIFVVVLMVFGGIHGAIYSAELGNLLNPYLKELINSVSGLNWWSMTVFIFQNNFKVAFLGILFGIIFGIIPFTNALINGVVIGYVVKITIDKASIFELWRIFPHGIFELPAIIIALGIGIKLGMSVLSKNRFSERFYASMNVLFYVVLPLLIIAALIEGILIFLFGN